MSDQTIWETAQIISGVLTPHQAYLEQAFWNKKLPSLMQVSTTIAILQERQLFFEQDRSRNNALTLVMMVDFGWQLVRDIGDILSKNDGDALGRKLQRSAESIALIDDIEWTYGVNSSLRHPASNFPNHNWLFSNPWPTGEAGRLLRAAEGVRSILHVIDIYFEPESGFEGEVDEKRFLSANAIAHWQAKLAAR